MRLKALTLSLILILNAFFSALANEEGALDLSPAPTPAPEPVANLAPLSEGPLETGVPVQADCAAVLLCEQDSGQIIFQMNETAQRPAASVTKVMTILLTLEALDAGQCRPDDIVTISKTAAGMGGSQVLLDVGEQQTLHTLLESVIVGSANDAAVALAESLFGSEEGCVNRMNTRARELGMSDTCFVNCTGLPAEGQHTTARDVAIMARALFSHPDYFEYSGTWMDDIDHGQNRVTQLVNTNKLLRLYDGCDGGKTGSTREAGYCIAATARRAGMRLVAVVLGADSGAERFDIASRMLDHGFANYRRYPVAQRGTRIRGTLPVTGGSEDGVALMLDTDLTLLVSRGEEQRIRLTPCLPPSLEAPVRAGDPVGSVQVVLDDRVLAEIPVVAASDISAYGLRPGLNRLWSLWAMF